MKKCPICERTFDDGMRFCQTDGTPLVDVSESAPGDAFKTVVSSQEEISAPPADPFKTMIGVPPLNKNEDILQLPDEPQEQAKNAPPSPFGSSASASESGPKGFDDPASTPLEIPKFKDTASSDSTLVLNTGSSDLPPKTDSTPFGNGSAGQSGFGNEQNAPIPSPFDASMPPRYNPPSTPPFKEPEQNFGSGQRDTYNQSPFEQPVFNQQSNPFNPPVQQNDWTPPPAPVSNWQDQGLGANTPFQPPVAGLGQNQTLAIVSLVLGVVSLFCCWLGFLLGPAGLITGFMARSKANNNPSEYGGGGLALAGMITGGVGTLISIAYFILIVLGMIASPR